MFNFTGPNAAALEANGFKIVPTPNAGGGWVVAGPGPNDTSVYLTVSGVWQVPPTQSPVFTVGGTADTRNQEHIEETLTDRAWKARLAFPGWVE